MVLTTPLFISAGGDLALLALTLVPASLFVCAIYRWRFSPLSSIPGPWYASISDFWLLTHVIRLQQCKTVHELFQTYGPVVRVGPSKVVFCDITAMRSVYSTNKFAKSTFYKSLLTNNNDHAMTTLPHAEHVIRKKAYAPHYVPSHLNLFQPEMHDFTLELMDILNQGNGKKDFPCIRLFRHLMVDVVSVNCFGYRLGALKKFAVGEEEVLCTAVEDFPKRGVMRSAVPTWAWSLICSIPNARWKQLCDSDRVMADFISARLSEMHSQMRSGKFADPEKQSMLQRMIQYRNASNEPMPDLHIVSEGMGHTVAGVDTSSTTLAYMFWTLSRRPEIMKKLQAEIDDVMPDSRSIPDISVLFKLPYLTGFVKEGLRIYGSGPSLLERVIPATTIGKNDSVVDGYGLMGHLLPPNTIVATQAWSMHRDPTIFPSPETFLPDRWLETADNAEQLTLMSQYMMPFGVGTRMCGGQNLAQIMIRVVLTSVVRNFNIVAPPETNEKSMDIRDAFVIFPAALECKLKFIPRTQ